MPELPEVETTCRGIRPHIEGHMIASVTVRQPKLRWPIPAGLEHKLKGQTIRSVERRAKYLLLHLDSGTLILHLGMSGSLRIHEQAVSPGKHDHFDLGLSNGRLLRLTDPRRFGAVLWTTAEPEKHELIRNLGPEPLSEGFNGKYLFEQSRGRRMTVKPFIMDGHIAVGVGNIYASESLFLAGIHPKRAAGRITLTRYEALAESIKQVLGAAIQQGGTTLRDFVGGDGKPGYFAQRLNVYGRGGQPCPKCGSAIRNITLGQRASYYCPHCQH